MNKVLINEQGVMLEILQGGQFLVHLSNHYDILNLERCSAVLWSFELEKWV